MPTSKPFTMRDVAHQIARQRGVTLSEAMLRADEIGNAPRPDPRSPRGLAQQLVAEGRAATIGEASLLVDQILRANKRVDRRAREMIVDDPSLSLNAARDQAQAALSLTDPVVLAARERAAKHVEKRALQIIGARPQLTLEQARTVAARELGVGDGR